MVSNFNNFVTITNISLITNIVINTVITRLYRITCNYESYNRHKVNTNKSKGMNGAAEVIAVSIAMDTSLANSLDISDSLPCGGYCDRY